MPAEMMNFSVWVKYDAARNVMANDDRGDLNDAWADNVSDKEVGPVHLIRLRITAPVPRAQEIAVTIPDPPPADVQVDLNPPPEPQCKLPPEPQRKSS